MWCDDTNCIYLFVKILINSINYFEIGIETDIDDVAFVMFNLYNNTDTNSSPVIAIKMNNNNKVEILQIWKICTLICNPSSTSLLPITPDRKLLFPSGTVVYVSGKYPPQLFRPFILNLQHD